MIEGSSVQEHWFKMLSFVEKLKDLKANLTKETYIYVILQCLPPSFDSFIVNYNMNGLDKDLHQLINMLVQYEAMIEMSALSVLIGEASTSKAKGKGAGRWRRKKGKTESTTTSAQSAPVARWARAKKRGKAVRQSWISKDVYINCREKGHWKRECPKLLSNQDTFSVYKAIISSFQTRSDWQDPFQKRLLLVKRSSQNTDQPPPARTDRRQRASNLVSSRPMSQQPATWRARDLQASDLPPLSLDLKLRDRTGMVLPSTVSRSWSRAWNWASVPILDQASMLST
ncbi:UNVERIFIED_CONTAM: hypothetical protein Slati_4412900 [Sesamum latifolium]|uniref:Zinc finger, CCHC-type n=1 Tax=Sesamum latifolium TaxID=2727402 RepID=A0AAW2SQH0_9LAMI